MSLPLSSLRHRPRSSSETRAEDVLRLRREISRMQQRRSEITVLPVLPALTELFPERGLRAGALYGVSPSPLLISALLAEATQKGHWCAVVGMPAFGAESAASLGADLSRILLVPDPGERTIGVLSALSEVVPFLVLAVPVAVSEAEQSRLQARLRDRGSTVLIAASAPGADWAHREGTISLEDARWQGLGNGWGVLSGCRATVSAVSRRDPRPRRITVDFPLTGMTPVTPGSEPHDLPAPHRNLAPFPEGGGQTPLRVLPRRAVG